MQNVCYMHVWHDGCCYMNVNSNFSPGDLAVVVSNADRPVAIISEIRSVLRNCRVAMWHDAWFAGFVVNFA